TQHPMIMSANEDYLSWEKMKDYLDQLLIAVAEDDYARVRKILMETVNGYAPDGDIVDWSYQQRHRNP
ncbi:polysaccharide biosynthesis protein, partial [Pseudomonas quasicaspiana]|nr:polysaccharide biosynthesis protein [Pseudomonas quasicaspiana]